MATNQATIAEPITRVEVVDFEGTPRRGWIPCRLGDNIRFDDEKLTTFCIKSWESVVFDGLLLAACVEFADRTTSRPAQGWRRQIHVRIPVHELERWENDRVRRSLTNSLGLLTGDIWYLSFTQRKRERKSFIQNTIPMPSADTVIPFSDGLDSFVVAKALCSQSSISPILVRVGLTSKNSFNSIPLAYVPYHVHCRDAAKNRGVRSRGFKFAITAGMTAFLSGANRIIVPESGQGAIGPAMVATGHWYEDYRNHPRFMQSMEEVILTLLGVKVDFEFPRLWHTKGETLRDFAETAVGWQTTRSCWLNRRWSSVNGKQRQCGICSACLLRRISVFSAELSECDDSYIWTNLSASNFADGASSSYQRMTKIRERYAVSAVSHLFSLGEFAIQQSKISSVDRQASILADCIKNITATDAKGKLLRLLNRHREECELFFQSLGESSFITNWLNILQ